MEHVQYYGIFRWNETKDQLGAVARCRVVDGIIYDEEYTRQAQWEPTDYFLRFLVGHQDDRYAEITEAEAQAFIERSERYLEQHPEQRDVVTVTRSPGAAVGIARYEGDGLPAHW